MKLVYVDIETDSLDEVNFQVIQIGAVGVRDNEIVDTFERKLMFDLDKANPEALKGNSYREDLWEKEAVPVELGLRHFSSFLSSFAEIKRFNPKTRRNFSVTQLAGHNSIRFDFPRLQELYRRENERIVKENPDPEDLKGKKLFFPGDYNPIDTIQVAKVLESIRGKRFEKHNLAFLCEAMGIQYQTDVTHDALYDAKLTYRLHQLLLGAIRDTVQGQSFFS